MKKWVSAHEWLAVRNEYEVNELAKLARKSKNYEKLVQNAKEMDFKGYKL